MKINLTQDDSDEQNNSSSNKMSLLDQGAMVVVLDMFFAIMSIVFNLMVITAIKDNEEMLRKTFNIVIISLCSSNLISAVMVKSISIVHNAYAVATNLKQSDIAFCILYQFGFRLTWSVLPWSIVVLSWATVVPRVRRLQVINYAQFTFLLTGCHFPRVCLFCQVQLQLKLELSF